MLSALSTRFLLQVDCACGRKSSIQSKTLASSLSWLALWSICVCLHLMGFRGHPTPYMGHTLPFLKLHLNCLSSFCLFFQARPTCSFKLGCPLEAAWIWVPGLMLLSVAEHFHVFLTLAKALNIAHLNFPEVYNLSMVLDFHQRRFLYR